MERNQSRTFNNNIQITFITPKKPLNSQTTLKTTAECQINSSTQKSKNSGIKFPNLFSTPETSKCSYPNLSNPLEYNPTSTNNLNFLLGSDLKFKSPNKLMSLKICDSPWISNEKRNNFLSQFFENSPSMKNSNYKVRFSDTIKQESRVISCFGRSNNEFRFSKDFELCPIEKEGAELKIVQREKFSGMKKFRRNGGFRDQREIDEEIENLRLQKKNESHEIRKRRRKSAQQLKVLKVEFEKCQNWTKDQITQISNLTGLTESQVYKWCWDQKKKIDEDEIENEGENCGILGEKNELVLKVKNGCQENGFDILGKRKVFGEVNDDRVGAGDKKFKF